ncbi:NAD(P) transhydrogenase subunit alpha [Mannheimia haemolytica]|uniref:proton-translocating NAD(P)(+) transhydrogenase n=1 Tax=Mannheimia haemolytica TaxID=75985 RepID=A0A378MYC1_MANHA|nr:NAD(P) transhydrogenase subunit alpha [Mannheimia haemolytica]
MEAGVAGLAAIGAANSLGAIVRAFDSRPEVKEQVKSMGADFLEIDFEEEGGSGDGYAKVMSEEFNRRAMALYAEQAKEVDIIITTAAIPGKPAPRLITKEMVDSMKPGSVIVDLAAATGGNCEYTKAGEIVVTDNQVKVIGYTDFPARLPTQSSQLYGTNLVNLLKLLAPNKDGQIEINFDDVVLRGVTVVRDGELTWPAPPIQVSAQLQKQAAAPQAVKKEEKTCRPSSEIWRDGSSRCAVPMACICGSGSVFIAFYRIRSRLCGRVLCGLERQPRTTYPINGGNKCDFRDYHRRCGITNCPTDR